MKRTVSLLSLFSLCAALTAIDWPQWRGVNRNGASSETGLLKRWPSGGPQLAWKFLGLGDGYASVSVAGGRIFTQGQRGNAQYIIAIDEASGRKLWETRNGGAYRERRGDGPRGVPTVDGEMVYALAADGTLSAVQAKDGKLVWTLSLVRDFGGSVPNWGYSESPLVHGERLIVTPGGSGHGVVALDKRTGRRLWSSQSDGAAYSSPILARVGEMDTILVFTDRGALGLRADNGELLWRYDKVSNRTANIATPIYKDGFAFFSSDYGTGCALLQLTAEGGGVRAKEVYFNRDMRNHYSSSVLVGDYLYGFSSSVLTAMNFKTGEVAWRDRSVGKGSVAYADGHLYVLGENGAIALVEATPEGYKEKSQFAINKSDRPTWAPPVIANGRLLIRDQDALYSFVVK
jgi:outer membrane protein assembly factor BamB